MGRDENSEREVLQAVLLADSFTSTFRPITLSPSTPRVLCPLNNVTLLDYSVEWLAGAGVEEVIVFCVSGHAAISEHIAHRNSQTTTSTGMKVDCISDPNCSNAGDALRELDRRGLIRSDPFLLLHGGDVVTNVDIAPALALHKARKKKDPSAMMTVLLKPIMNSTSSSQSPIRSTLEDLIVGIDMSKNDPDRILLFDSHPRRHSLSLPCSFFASHSNITVRSDLLDTGIDICSPEVLARFSDEFDYRHVRKQFLANSVAEEEEGLQNKIYSYLLPKHEYAARVQDLRTYHTISQDLLRRWCYPVVPDNLPSGYERKFRYSLNRHYVYKEVKASMGRGKKSQFGVMTKIARKSTIGSGTLLGAHVQIGEGCVVYKSVIGHDCTVDDHSRISNSHLWNNVKVHSNASISHSVLCDNVIVHKNAVIGKGCVIGMGCIIGENVILPDFTRITMEEERENDDDEFDDFGDESDEESEDQPQSEDEDENGNKMNKTDHHVVGPDGLGRVWNPPPTAFTEDDPDADSDYDTDSDFDQSDIEDEDGDENLLANENGYDFDIAIPKQRIHSQSIGYDIVSLYSKRQSVQWREGQDEDDEYVSDEHDDDSEYMHMVDETNKNVLSGSKGTDVMSSTYYGDSSSNINQEGLMITGRSRGMDVVKELKAICMEHDSFSKIENLMIELNGFKFSQNASFSDCVSGAILAVMDRIGLKAGVTTSVTLCESMKKELAHWKPLFTKMCYSIVEEKSILFALENAAVSGGDVGGVLSKAPSFRLLLQTLYDMEILSEEAILGWSQERREDFEKEEGPKKTLFFQQPTQTFLEWLEEDSESDEDDDSSEEESD